MTPSHDSLRGELAALCDRLSGPQLLLLRKAAEAMTRPVAAILDPNSDLTTPAFALAFSNQLVLHHVVSDEPLKKKSFEYLLRNAFEAGGKSATVNPQTSSWVVTADGVQYSCKTEAESKMVRGRVRIQKFMDGTWVRECADAAAYAAKAAEVFPTHLARYDRMLVLRVFRLPATAYLYQLVEVPLDVLGRLGSLSPAQIVRTRGTKESRAFAADVTAPGPDGQSVKAFRVLFDRSVNKVRLHGIDVSLCRLHGEWTIPLQPEAGRSPADE